MVGKGLIRDTSQSAIIQLMVGRNVDHIFPARTPSIGAPVLEVKDLSHPTEFDSIDFTLHAGEILGFYGLVGAGRSEIMQAIFGLTRTSRGTITLDGKLLNAASPADAIDAGHRLCARGTRQAGRRGRPADLPERRSAVAEKDQPQRLPAAGP